MAKSLFLVRIKFTTFEEIVQNTKIVTFQQFFLNKCLKFRGMPGSSSDVCDFF